MLLAEARHIFAEISAALAPACLRLEVAGSIRRECPEPGDIEIVCIPRPVRPRLGHPEITNQLAARLADLCHLDRICPRLDKNGRRAWGTKFLRAQWGSQNNPKTMGRVYALDLFITTPACWGVIFTLRTGSVEFSRRLVTPQEYGGAMPTLMFCRDGRLWKLPHAEACKDQAAALDTPEERDVFAALGLPWIAPRDRSGEYLKRLLNSRTGIPA